MLWFVFFLKVLNFQFSFLISAIVVKSVTKKRIEENTRLETEISEEDVNSLDNVEQEEKYDWNPEEVV